MKRKFSGAILNTIGSVIRDDEELTKPLTFPTLAVRPGVKFTDFRKRLDEDGRAAFPWTYT